MPVLETSSMSASIIRSLHITTASHTGVTKIERVTVQKP